MIEKSPLKKKSSAGILSAAGLDTRVPAAYNEIAVCKGSGAMPLRKGKLDPHYLIRIIPA